MGVGLPCVPLSDRYNALYGTSEFHGAMEKEAVQNRNVASVIAATRNAKTLAGGTGSFWPTPEWHRQCASKIVPDRLQECSKAMLAGQCPDNEGTGHGFQAAHYCHRQVPDTTP